MRIGIHFGMATGAYHVGGMGTNWHHCGHYGWTSSCEKNKTILQVIRMEFHLSEPVSLFNIDNLEDNVLSASQYTHTRKLHDKFHFSVFSTV